VLLLAIDTAGPFGGITLAEFGENSFRVVESAPIAGGTFSAQLIPTMATLLSKHGFTAKDLGGFAAASGPGSFTGLRVGLSAIKGLAEVLHKPIAVVSVLEALAALSTEAGNIATALDAGRSEVFLGLYHDSNDTVPKMISEKLLSQTTFLEELRRAAPAMVVTSDRPILEISGAADVRSILVERPGSEMIARLGARKLLAGDTISVDALDANYLRRSDAEIFFKGSR
jgi:tRNA threonylcarbamoyladenosine biosynthesis protein TsaB